MQKFKQSIWTYLQSKDIDSLKKLLSHAEEIEILSVIKELSSEEQVIVYRLLTKERALVVFEQLDTSSQQKLLQSFTEEKVAELVNELAPDDRVRLLEELPATVAKKLIASLSSEERESTNILMGYEAKTAGRVMTTEYIALKREMTVAEALKKIKANAEDKETIYTLYVTDSARKLEGVLSLKDLVLAEAEDKIEDIMNKKVMKVSTGTDQEEVARTLQEFDLLAVPVVDKEERLVGIITVDDAMDILEEESTEDMYIQAGLATLKNKEHDRSLTLIEGSLWEILKVRIPILILVLAGGFLAGMIVEGFEEVLASITAVAFFMPLIMDMGGSIGGQSTTIFARGVVLGHIKMDRFWKHLGKEALVGGSIGILVGIMACLAAWLWLGDPLIGLAVGLALVGSCFVAAVCGFLVPFFLIKIGADQAAGSGPIITSIKDISGLLIYFWLVSTLLTHLM